MTWRSRVTVAVLTAAAVFLAGPAPKTWGEDRGGEWTLRFKRRAATDARFMYFAILLNGREIKKFDISVSGKTPAVAEEIDLTGKIKPGDKLSLRLVSKGWHKSAWLIDDVCVLHQGRPVRFTPWTKAKHLTAPGPASVRAGIIGGDERRLCFETLPSKPKTRGSWVQFTTAPIKDAPELEIRHSGLNFTPEVEMMKPGGKIGISATVRNTGAKDASGAVVEMWINGKKVSSSRPFKVKAGSSTTREFHWTLPKNRKFATRIEARVVSAEDDLKVNNTIARYIPVKHPYLFFRDIKKTAGYKYRDKEPYKTWWREALAAANKGLGLNFSGIRSENRKAWYAKNLAFAYQMTGDEKYAAKALEALRCLGDGVSTGRQYMVKFGHYAWGVMHYTLAYDWLQPYIVKKGGHKLDREIQDRLAKIMNEKVWYRIFHYLGPGGGIYDESLGSGGHTMCAGDVIMCGCALLGYNGKERDKGNPYQWVKSAEADLCVKMQGGGPWPYLRVECTPDGIYGNNGYRGYSNYATPLMANAYVNSFGVSLTEKYKIFHGYLNEHMYADLPCGLGYPRAAHWQWVAGEQVMVPPVYPGDEGAFHQWYANRNIVDNREGYYIIWRDSMTETTPIWAEKIALYDRDRPEKEPSFEGDPTYFFAEGGLAIFRSGWDHDALYMCVKAMHHPIKAGQSSVMDQASYDIWAKYAYLSPDSGQCRWAGGSARGFTESAGAHNTILIDSLGFDRHSNSYTTFRNKAYLENNFATASLDYAEVRMKVDWLKVLPGKTGKGGKIAEPVAFRRHIIFPGNEYFIILDDLKCARSRKYEMLLHYSGTRADAAGPVIQKSKCVKGKLFIEDKEIDWRKQTPLDKALAEGVRNIRWVGESFVNKQFTESQPVELRTFVVPRVSVSYELGPSHFGGFDAADDFWHPYLKCLQEGKSVKYLTIQYPRRVEGGPNPKIEEVQVKGGSGDDYAARLVRGDAVDLVSISDGESITAGDMKTDAKIAYTRLAGGKVAIAMMAHGRRLSRGGKVVLSASEKVDHLSAGLTGKSLSGHVSGKEGTQISVFSPSPVRKLVFKPHRPNWIPRGDETKYAERELKFTYRNGMLTFKCPKEQGKFFVR